MLCTLLINFSARFCVKIENRHSMLQRNVTRGQNCAGLKMFYSNPKEDDHELKFTPTGTEEEAPKPLGRSGGYAT
jgi:hypothetical protein